MMPQDVDFWGVTLEISTTGKYIKLPLSKIAEFDAHRGGWRVTPSPTEPEIFEY